MSVPEEALVRRASPPDNSVHAEIARLQRELVGVREAWAKRGRGRTRPRRDRWNYPPTLAAERARTEKAFAAFSALADRLDVLTAVPRRPWWRRLAG